MSNVYGYIRVSTREQNEKKQYLALREAGVPEKAIFLDKQSGKDFNRPQYKKLLRKLKNDDLLDIKSTDRLGRNYEEILHEWRVLNREKGVGVVVLYMPLPENFGVCYQSWKQGELSGSAAAKECGMPFATFRYRAEDYEIFSIR